MDKPNSHTAGQFIEQLLGQGRYTFTREEAARRLGGSAAATYMSLRRLIQAKRLIMPRSGFYVIVDPQHRVAGTLPPEWFIDTLMKDMNRPYYVGLLSAAQLLGAAHHRPQEFQVMVPQYTTRPIRAGNVQIHFYGKGPFKDSQTQDVKTPAGIIKASTPETTAWDIVRYFKVAGGLDNVATVLSELAERLNGDKLRDTLKRHKETIVIQRLGYLMDILGQRNLAENFADLVKDARTRLLDPTTRAEKAPENKKWRLLINTKIEPDT